MTTLEASKKWQSSSLATCSYASATPTLLVSAPRNLGAIDPLRRADGRWCDDHDIRNWHIWLNRRLPNGAHKRGNTLRRVPGIVLVHGLKIVAAKHEQNCRQRRVDLNALLQAQQPVATWFIRVFPNRPAAVQGVLDHTYGVSSRG